MSVAQGAKEVRIDYLEKRKHPRTKKYGSQDLTITRRGPEIKDRTFKGVLWDFGEGGVGMDLPRALDKGEIVTVKGDLRNPGYSISLKAKARVAYCRRVMRDHYRVGFAFLEVSYRRLQPKDSE